MHVCTYAYLSIVLSCVAKILGIVDFLQRSLFGPDMLRFTSKETVSASRHHSYVPIGPPQRFSDSEAPRGHAVTRRIANSHWLLSLYEVWFVFFFVVL